MSGFERFARDHGGIAYVKEEWNARSNLKRSLETAQAKVERQQRHIEFVQGKCRERQGRIEEDAGCTAAKYNERRGTIFTTKHQVARDLVRRCRALADRERGD